MSFTAALRDLNKLNTFVRVAQRRSFTKAAIELRTRPSVISKRMKELEEALGFSLLFNRSYAWSSADGCWRRTVSTLYLQLLKEVDDYVTEQNPESGRRAVRNSARSRHKRLCAFCAGASDNQICEVAACGSRSSVRRSAQRLVCGRGIRYNYKRPKAGVARLYRSRSRLD